MAQVVEDLAVAEAEEDMAAVEVVEAMEVVAMAAGERMHPLFCSVEMLTTGSYGGGGYSGGGGYQSGGGGYQSGGGGGKSTHSCSVRRHELYSRDSRASLERSKGFRAQQCDLLFLLPETMLTLIISRWIWWRYVPITH